jgi:N-acyl-D-amino-acid deacylase
MKRRAFLQRVAGGATLLLTKSWNAQGAGAPTGSETVILRGGHVFDGTGTPGRDVDVAISGDRIVGIARNLRMAAAQVYDLRGLAIAPGFIDIHSHTDLGLFVDADAQSKIRQGVTTEVPGQDGSSIGPWTRERSQAVTLRYRDRYGVALQVHDLASFFAALERHGTSVNVASMVGAGTIRDYVIGEKDRAATPEELERMKALVREALAAGACGLSSGLEYVPGAFANRAELIALARVLKGSGLPYATHMRNEDDELLAAVEEAIAIGRFAGVPVQISHLKAQGKRNWFKAGAVVDVIDAARRDGIDVMFDRYPYIAYSTGLSNLFPVWARDGGTVELLRRLQDASQQERIRSYVEDKIAQLGSWDAVQISGTGSDALAWARGKRLGALAAERSKQPYDLLVEITIADQERSGMIGFGMDEPNTERFLAHPLCMICSDGGALSTEGPLSEGNPHPRSFGTFPRVLGHYVRERKIMPLQTAVAKMTGMTAKRLQLRDRGQIRVGAFADVVAFDPDKVADRATFEAPHAYPVGIEHVWVNGVQVIRNSQHTGARPGRVVKPQS